MKNVNEYMKDHIFELRRKILAYIYMIFRMTLDEFHTDKSRIVLNNDGAVITKFFYSISFHMGLVKEVAYQATITTAESKETYVGLNATEFKTRWRNHQMSFKHESKRNDTMVWYGIYLKVANVGSGCPISRARGSCFKRATI